MLSCNNNTSPDGYPKRLYWENNSLATQINDSIVIIVDRKSFNETETKVINLNHVKLDYKIK